MKLFVPKSINQFLHEIDETNRRDAVGFGPCFAATVDQITFCDLESVSRKMEAADEVGADERLKRGRRPRLKI
jgi:hypothetical protein